MADRLADFVIKLASDPRAVEQFRVDPDAAVRGAGLSSAEQAVLASGNPTLIRQAVAANLGQAGAAATEWVVVIVNVKSVLEQVRTPGAIRPFNDLVNNLMT